MRVYIQNMGERFMQISEGRREKGVQEGSKRERQATSEKSHIMMNFHNHNHGHDLTLNICLQQQPILIPIQSGNNVEIHHRQHQNRKATYLASILGLLSFIVPVLLDLINLKFKKDVHSVFEAYPTTTKLIVSGLLTYVLAFGLVSFLHTCRLSPTRAALLRTLMVLSAFLSLASLASLLLPDSFRPLLYVLYALLSLGNFYNEVWKWCHWVHRKIKYNLVEPVLTVMRRQWHMRRRPSNFAP